MQFGKFIFALGITLLAGIQALGQSKDIVDTAVSAGSFGTLAKALQAAGLVDALKGDGPFTVFAPSDEAFAKLPPDVLNSLLQPENKDRLTAILTYHVVAARLPASQVVNLHGLRTLNGQQVDLQVGEASVKIDNASIQQTDIECSNGIIHVIDQVLLPAEDSIPAVAANAGDFGTLLAAVQAAGLADVLSGDGAFTVFAPTDGAFGKLPAGTVENLLKPENKGRLADILKYHVLPGRVYSRDALATGAAKTLEGSAIRISLTDVGTTKVNNANLIAPDIDASNGVIHVIDTVLLPSADPQSQYGKMRDMIATAINTGAPLYNAGHHSACAKVYMTTINDLLAVENHGMSDATVDTLRTALTEAEHSRNAGSRAWVLRRALDTAYNSMGTVR